ncbi:MAG: PIN domain-containing protein [Candidatus Hydrogenedentes bacterium]|nr:PIN domain-containing protein [Candidatus Hydrogenedentota bacterium]
MAVTYSIQAEIIDITSDSPRAEDVFLVDTNVWYWVAYPNATSFHSSQLSDYPNYLNGALEAGSTIHHTGLSLAELSHLIEKTEREIYTEYVSEVKPKEYRHNCAQERSRVVSEIQAAWSQVCSLAAPLTATIDAQTTAAALDRFQNEMVDGYDLFILESMKSNGVVQVITDDGDYSSVSGIQVFTANKNVVRAAENQRKLLTR